MPTKAPKLGPLQRELLATALKKRSGRLWLERVSVDTLASTYAAIESLQKRKLVEREPPRDPKVLSWKVTKAGRDALKSGEAKAR